MMRNLSRTVLCTFIITLVAAASAFGEKTSVGIGISATEQDTTIYVPVRTGSLLIEPMVGYSFDKEENTLTGNYTVRDKFDERMIGVGVFLVKNVIDKLEQMEFLAGARVAYIDYQNESVFDVDGNGIYSGTQTDADGYMIAPTLGVEYKIGAHLSAGIYVAFEYVRLKGDSVSSDNYNHVDFTYERTITDTSTDLFLKYYF
jgi:hypothetical protein